MPSGKLQAVKQGKTRVKNEDRYEAYLKSLPLSWRLWAMTYASRPYA